MPQQQQAQHGAWQQYPQYGNVHAQGQQVHMQHAQYNPQSDRVPVHQSPVGSSAAMQHDVTGAHAQPVAPRSTEDGGLLIEANGIKIRLAAAQAHQAPSIVAAMQQGAPSRAAAASKPVKLPRRGYQLPTYNGNNPGVDAVRFKQLAQSTVDEFDLPVRSYAPQMFVGKALTWMPQYLCFSCVFANSLLVTGVTVGADVVAMTVGAVIASPASGHGHSVAGRGNRRMPPRTVRGEGLNKALQDLAAALL